MIYIIRTRNNDRSAPLIKNLSREFKLVDGFIGSQIVNAGFKYQAYSGGNILNPRQMGKGEMGAMISHTMAITMAKADKAPYALIFEDDARISADFEKKFENLNLLVDADLIMLGGILLNENANVGPFVEYGGNMRVVQHSQVFGLHAYIVFERSYNKILDLLYTQANCCDDLILNNKNIKVLMCDPWLAYQAEGESVIWPERGVNLNLHSKFKYKE